MISRIIISAAMLSFALAVGACSDTWQGAKKDTGDNMQSTGQAIEDAGKKVKK
jgi:predicted small secreted protein